MSTGPFSAPPGKASVALIVSLCINVLLVGVIAMAIVRFAMVHRMGPGLAEVRHEERSGAVPVQMILNPRALMHAAPAERDKIRDVLKSHRDRVMTLRQASMAARREVMAELTSPDFDKAAFRRSLANMQQADSALESEVLDVMADSTAVLTPEERQAVANQPPPRPFWRFRRDRHH